MAVTQQSKTQSKLLFSQPAAEESGAAKQKEPWNILIVDDESIMHSVTKLVLRDFTFENRPLNFHSAYSGEEAKKIIRDTSGICVSLIDIVMEEDHSGLDLVRWIREENENSEMRIILRTGQPGLAPEREVIQKYEINDYKEKTELTDTKLITALTVAIRGFRDLHVLNRNRSGFEQILQGSGDIWKSDDPLSLISFINRQFGSIVSGEDSVNTDSLVIQKKSDGVSVLTGSGNFKKYTGQEPDDLEKLGFDGISSLCHSDEDYLYSSPYLVCSLNSRQSDKTCLIAKLEKEPDETDRTILSAFLLNVSLAMDNWLLSLNRSKSQKNMLFFLSEVIEQHFSETGNHIRRVSEMVHILASGMGIDRSLAESWKMASILHDIGKIGIPDKILKKPGKLTDDEFEIMKSHVIIGHKMLSSNEDAFFPDAADIALYHHECWDGSGYPEGLSGEDIPLPARILAVVDVFDALTHKRIYKDSWSIEKTTEFLMERKGVNFDPNVVDHFTEYMEQMKGILDAYPD